MTLTAINAAGVTATNFSVIENDVGLVINPLSSDQLNQSTVTVTGFIGDPVDDCVAVNGVQATVYDDGSWEADDVPVNPTGTASLLVEVYIEDPVLIASQTAYQPQPAMVVLAGYSGVEKCYDSSTLEANTINWAYDAGGMEGNSGHTPNDAETAENYFNFTDSLPADGPGFATPDLGLVWDYFSVNTSFLTAWGSPVYFQRSSGAQVMIVPSGQQQAGATNVYLVFASTRNIPTPFNISRVPEMCLCRRNGWRFKTRL